MPIQFKSSLKSKKKTITKFKKKQRKKAESLALPKPKPWKEKKKEEKQNFLCFFLIERTIKTESHKRNEIKAHRFPRGKAVNTKLKPLHHPLGEAIGSGRDCRISSSLFFPYNFFFVLFCVGSFLCNDGFINKKKKTDSETLKANTFSTEKVSLLLFCLYESEREVCLSRAQTCSHG